MASAQVLPNAAASTAKKQQLLAAGKLRLEEFRRKKALEKGKNAALARHSRDTNDNNSSQTEQVRPADTDELGPSTRADGTTDESLGAISSGSEAVETVPNNRQASSVQTVAPLPFSKGSTYSNNVQLHLADQDYTPNVDWRYKLKEDYKVTENAKENGKESGISNGQQSQHMISEPYYYHESASCDKEKKTSEVNNFSSFSFSGPDSSQNIAGSGTSFENQKKFGSSFTFLSSPFGTPSTISERLSSGFKSDGSLSEHALTDSAKISTSSTRSHPSFLDTIEVSSLTPFPSPAERKQLNTNISNTTDVSHLSNELKAVEAPKSYGSYSANNPAGISLDSANNGSYQFSGLSNVNWNEHENIYNSAKQNEDFAALEEHIEDLSREKFSLQRAVEASRALAESLASENSALTDSYNQQGSVVNQLKLEMERLQEEIRGQSVELEAVKSEYVNALLECNAADERAKLLASEVISLEEKALRLRSNELKLERQLETAVSESSSLKKKISSLERERQDLHASIAAFQEEKRLLQSKLRKLSANGSDEVNNSSIKKNASTSTDGLGPAVAVDNSDTLMRETESSSEISDLNSTRFPETVVEVNLQLGSGFIPSDQIEVIQNINALLSELALEKEGLIRTLKVESSKCSKFKELNKELSKRLEFQTQRLELLTAQSMAGDNVVTRQTEFLSINDPVIYADEGDEVVERVLGWIMKLFPSGPSKRRTSKLI